MQMRALGAEWQHKSRWRAFRFPRRLGRSLRPAARCQRVMGYGLISALVILGEWGCDGTKARLGDTGTGSGGTGDTGSGAGGAGAGGSGASGVGGSATGGPSEVGPCAEESLSAEESAAYFPLAVGQRWMFRRRMGYGTPSSSVDILRRDVTGNKAEGGASARVVVDLHPNGSGETAYLELASSGIINHGTNGPASEFGPLGAFAAPYTAIPFPIRTCVKYEPYSVSGVDVGTDNDQDGVSDTGTVRATSMLSFEDVTVPIGTFKRTLRFETVATLTVSFTGKGKNSRTSQQRSVEWYAFDVGLVKRYLTIVNGEYNDELIAYAVGDDRHGVMPVGWLAHDVKRLESVPEGVDHPAVASDGKQFLVAVPSNNEKDVPNGNMVVVVVDQNGKPVSAAPLSNTKDDLYSPSLAWNGRRYLVAYVNENRGVEVVTLSASGEKLNGPTVLDQKGWKPHVLGVDNGFLVAYSVGSGGSTSKVPGGMWVATLDDSGTTTSLVRAYPDTAQADPVLVKDGAGGLMALFRVPLTGPAASLSYGDSLAFARLTPDGHAVDPAPTILHESLELRHGDYNLIFDGTNFLASWSQRGSSDLDVYVARISREGEILGGAGGSAIVGAGASPRTMAFGSGFLMIWGQQLKSDSWSEGIGGTRLALDGRPLDPTSEEGDGTWLSTDFGAERDSLYAAAWGGDRALIVWTGYESTRLSPSDLRGLACAVAYPW
jgi:hypothetical protein